MKDIAAMRIRDALQWYAAAIETREDEPDHGFSILPVSEDLDEGQLEIHVKDTLAKETNSGSVFLMTLTETE